MAAQRHRADGLAEPHDPVEGQGRQEPRRCSRSRCSPIRCCRPPTCCSIRPPTCRWARTRSSIWNWPATSRRSSTTTLAKAPVFTLPDPIIPPEAARIMSLRDGSAKMSKSDPSDMSRINLTDDADTIMQKVKQGQDRSRTAAQRRRRASKAAPKPKIWSASMPRWPAAASRRCWRIRRPGLWQVQAGAGRTAGQQARPSTQLCKKVPRKPERLLSLRSTGPIRRWVCCADNLLHDSGVNTLPFNNSSAHFG
jgi:hypothetical protein